MLPARRKQARSGILRASRREWPRHRRFVRSHLCVVPGCEAGPIEFAHVRSAATAGTGIKPADWHGVSMCHTHHAESHAIGDLSFQRKYGIDLAKLAAEFAAKSPDTAMRDTMREVGDAR